MEEARAGDIALPQVIEDSVILAWTVHPVVDRPARTALLVALSIPFLWVLLRFFEVAYTVIAVGLLLMFLSGYFFPTRYELTDVGVNIRSRFYRATRSWAEFDQWRAYADAVCLLRPDEGVRSRMNRNCLLLLKGNRDQVLGVITERLGDPG